MCESFELIASDKELEQAVKRIERDFLEWNKRCVPATACQLVGDAKAGLRSILVDHLIVRGKVSRIVLFFLEVPCICLCVPATASMLVRRANSTPWASVADLTASFRPETSPQTGLLCVWNVTS